MKKLKFSIPFCLLLVFNSCSTTSSRHVSFQKPETFGSRLFYSATKSATNGVIERPSPSEETLKGLARLKDLGNELLTDLGGIYISLEIGNRKYIEGLYFDPVTFRAKQTSAYKKWRNILKNPKNCRLAEMYESEFSGNHLLSLFSIPGSIRTHPVAKKKPMGVLVLPEYGLTFQLDPKAILTYLARGMHVFAINYRSEDKIPEWKSTCSDAMVAFDWLKARLKSSNKDMIIYGKSFGTGPAIYLGTQLKESTLILERPFARMSDLCEFRQNGPIAMITSPFAKSFVEKYFRYPNEDWIKKVKGKILILESIDDEAIVGHAQRLIDAKTASLGSEEKKRYVDKYWLKVRGSHFGRFWGDSSITWYSSEINQNRLDRFLQEL